MVEKGCGCGKEDGQRVCEACGVDDTPAYWCASCNRYVDQKRCPLCGLKTRREKGAKRP